MPCPGCGIEMKRIGAAINMRTRETVFVVYQCCRCRQFFQDWKEEMEDA